MTPFLCDSRALVSCLALPETRRQQRFVDFFVDICRTGAIAQHIWRWVNKQVVVFGDLPNFILRGQKFHNLGCDFGLAALSNCARTGNLTSGRIPTFLVIDEIYFLLLYEFEDEYFAHYEKM